MPICCLYLKSIFTSKINIRRVHKILIIEYIQFDHKHNIYLEEGVNTYRSSPEINKEEKMQQTSFARNLNKLNTSKVIKYTAASVYIYLVISYGTELLI